MTYGESNGHVTDDGTWPPKAQCQYAYRPSISKTAGMPFRNNRHWCIRSAILATAWLLVANLFQNDGGLCNTLATKPSDTH